MAGNMIGVIRNGTGGFQLMSNREIEVLEFFCKITTDVGAKIFHNEVATDCFCGIVLRNFSSSFSVDQKVLDWIKEAIEEKINRTGGTMWKNLGQIFPGEYYHTLCSSTVLTQNGDLSVEEVINFCAQLVHLPMAYVVCGENVLLWESEEAAKKALAASKVELMTVNYMPAILANGEAWEGKLYSNGIFLPMIKVQVSDPDLILHVDTNNQIIRKNS